MSTNKVDCFGSIDQVAVLAQWFCQHAPKRALVMDLSQSLVVAADQESLRASKVELDQLPVTPQRILAEGIWDAIKLAKTELTLSSPFAGAQLESIPTWRYEVLIAGELGVLYEPNCFNDSCNSGWDAPLAEKDDLTQLFARGVLTPSLENALDRWKSTGMGFAVLFLDFDHFKQINDQFGHLAGDAVLRQAAKGILHAIRPGDVAVRYGGDEFVIVIGGLHSPSEALSVARRVAMAHANKTTWNSSEIPFTISIGVAFSRTTDSTAKEILERADQAMYRAKKRGRRGEIVLD